ncbi:phenylacetate--CoA ligase family protein [Lacinutrix algicola]|uniref:phenylacetate--CoA ligase family protein n=1 Tax=Lacinutrix algicola TaxID=342954 RepID=UPI000ACDF80A|nr:phenylacetate--CoA ligase family protein [Lacinutrix algicola]
MDNLFFKLPNVLQNIIISLYNTYLYSKRYGGKYKHYKKKFLKQQSYSLEELQDYQNNQFIKFLNYAEVNSAYYKKAYKNIDIKSFKDVKDIAKLPILNKEDLRTQIDKVYTIKPSQGIVSKTGGTTGKPLKVVFTKDDANRRYGYLDNFRNNYGYNLGKKTAWFSGKKLLSERDIKKNRFWKHDFLNKVRYYSTFHINETYLKSYLIDLINYKPEFLVGFPSTLLEIANFGIRNNIQFPTNVVRAIFPTAETVTEETALALSEYFNTTVLDQYASSEGAPFIFQCEKGNYHLDIRTGVFEILDSNDVEAEEGRLVVTSFTTHGTPLIRYDIGDSVEKSNSSKCNCNNNNPIIKKILGRENDYIFSQETGKINLGNVSNTLKGVSGIKRFQAIQDVLDEITILIEKDNTYNSKNEEFFLKNWRDRVGASMKINLTYVDHIPTEKSGKFRIVKNLMSIHD